MKIITLNLKGLNLNEPRFLKIISVLKKLDADIVVFQEAVNNISNELNSLLKYPYSDFRPCFDCSKDYGKGIFQKTKKIEGLLVLSNLKFKSKKINLPIIKGLDRWPRIAQLCNFGEFKLCNLHLSKYKKSRDLEWSKLPRDSILIGDFNMKPSEIKIRKGKLKSSYVFKEYLSYPKDKTTFDYCLLPKGKFINLKLIRNVSDHNGLFLEIEV